MVQPPQIIDLTWLLCSGIYRITAVLCSGCVVAVVTQWRLLTWLPLGALIYVSVSSAFWRQEYQVLDMEMGVVTSHEYESIPVGLILKNILWSTWVIFYSKNILLSTWVIFYILHG